MTPAELEAAGHQLDETGYSRLARFVDRLLEENRRLNLTAARDAATLWRQHVCDSLSLRRVLPVNEALKLLDLGTGGGLPGIPLACACPAWRLALLDATRKKIEAVRRITTSLGLANVSLLCGRAEVLAHEPHLREQYPVVTARAVAPLRTLLELAAGFVAVGGSAWFFKTSRTWEEEAAEAESAVRACEFAFQRAVPYALPDGAEHVLLEYRKRKPLRPDLPRGPGRPAKRPL